MRYPVGFRHSWADALQAAREAATMTGLRYRVEYVPDALPACEVWDAWEFAPIEVPGEGHMGVMV